MNWILKLVWLLFGHYAKLKMVNEAKRQGVVAYMRILQGSRRALVALLVAFFVMQSMVLSAFGALLTGFWLWDYDVAAKVQILFWIFCAMFVIPALFLMFVLSERVWYRASGAKRMVEDLKRSA